MKLTKNIDQYRPAVYTKNHSRSFVVLAHPYGYYIDDSCFVYWCVRYNGGCLSHNEPIGLFSHELYCNYRKTYTAHFSSWRRHTENNFSVLLVCALMFACTTYYRPSWLTIFVILFRLSRKMFVHFVSHSPIVPYREDITWSEYVPTDVVHQNVSLYSIFIL